MITIIKEVSSELLFTVRNYNSTATYSVDLTRVGYDTTTNIVLNSPIIYAGRALKFTTDLTSYSEASYNYILKEDEEEVDNGTFYFLNLNTNENDIYL
jgi:hypothetical protein